MGSLAWGLSGAHIDATVPIDLQRLFKRPLRPMKMNVRLLMICPIILFAFTCDGQVLAGDNVGPPDMLCNSIGTPAPVSSIDVLQKRIREGIARNDWRYIRPLIWDGADPDWTRNTKWYKRALQEAINRDLVHASAIGDEQLILRLIHTGANVNVKPDYDENMSPLIWAARCDQASAARSLLDRGADVNITADFAGSTTGMVEGSTPLIWAASYGNVDVVRILLARGADPNAQEIVIDDINKPAEKRKGHTPLVESVNKETTELLLLAKADPNLVGSNDISPLMMAAFRGNLEQCELLLAWGANPRLKDRFGQTAADWAQQAKHMLVAKLLRDLE
jgi:ankyrin repeat protein